MSAGLDVIVPCYNYGRFLRQCVGSVLQGAQLPIRVLVIDDASPDGSAEVARRIAREDPRVEVIVHAANRGHIATYNEGIDWVRQDYMLLLSADDMVAPGALVRAVALMQARPGIAFAHGRAVRFSTEDELPRQVFVGGDAPVTVSRGADFVRRLCAHPMNPVETPTAVVRTAVQKRVGGYRPHLPHAGDLEMWLRCAAHGDVGELAANQGYVRIHDCNMRHGYAGTQFLRDYRQRRDAFESFFAEYGRSLADGAALRAQALGALARDLLWEASYAVEAGQPARKMIAAARELWPPVRWTRQYRRLAVKRFIQPLRSAPGPRSHHASA